jgi:type I restriction enzyme, S subunit
VPNEPSDSAKTLLQKIKSEKAKSGNKEKPLLPIEMEEIPFEIPANWVWCRLGEVAEMTRGRFSIRPRNDPSYFGGEYPFIQIGSLDEKGSVINDAPQTLNEKGIKVSKKFPKNTIVIAIVGGTIGNLGILGREMYFTDSMVGIVPSQLYNQDFILFFLKSKQPEIKSEAYQMAGQPNIKIPTLENLKLPLPPLAEQTRIVAQLEKLMQLCDGLEWSIQRSKTQNESLLQQVLRESLSGSD